MCLEKRVFYRVISGLHASINIHLCSKYLLVPQDSLQSSSDNQWGPNLKELERRFSPEITGGEGPSWLKNLYFTYLLQLRALAKAAPYLEREEYYRKQNRRQRYKTGYERYTEHSQVNHCLLAEM